MNIFHYHFHQHNLSLIDFLVQQILVLHLHQPVNPKNICIYIHTYFIHPHEKKYYEALLHTHTHIEIEANSSNHSQIL